MDTSSSLDAMVNMNELDDLGNLFEFGDIDLNSITDGASYGDQSQQQQQQQQQHGTHPTTPFQDMSQAPAMSGTAAHDFGQTPFAISQSMEYAMPHDGRVTTSNPYAPEATYQASSHASYLPYSQNFNFQAQPSYPSNAHVPPTPNSYDMHGETGTFMHQQSAMDPQQRTILEQRYGLRKDDAIAFTPMVSPAGTPQFNVLPEYTTPGAYFSPLTSPMLHGQTHQQNQLQQTPHQTPQQRAYTSHPNTAPGSHTNSPIDFGLDIDMLDNLTLPDSAGPRPRRTKRKPAAPRSATGLAKAKQSPAQTAQKRKSMLSSSGQSRGEETIASQPLSAGLQMPHQFDSSEPESISPEPLGESAMGPPPRPASSRTHSPAIAAQQKPIGAAATPKSLLTMRGVQPPIYGQQTASPGSKDSNSLDDLSLPEAARAQARIKPSLSQIDTQVDPDATDDLTPQNSARKTPKLGPSSTPASGRLGSAVTSPNLTGSPMTACTPSLALKDKKDARSGSGSVSRSKKRGSISATGSRLVSPALVPKISPSIKPLLPEGTPLNTATQAMLLASKSNYQNLLEGNHLPGVNYPDSLSTGLTSKRTSHKVAEQGRRNRINEALKEMQSLIPKPPPASKSPGDAADAAADSNGDANATATDGDGAGDANGNGKDGDNSAKSNNSKAATVELANDYIKKMQKDSAATSAEVAILRRENEELRKRLLERESGSGSEAGAVASSGDGEE
ncbi:hypothetical protein BDY17DRAFT_322731 [Neohortaea acidophila]|uniref:BHLH domain-containing protein n=1 Tax=Neohortaea acidophila TaxID=245834 RepID=A0A6A6PV18_9PEZI|nr:uncharacterized protein BDY17DRAFT_322731 [Neohortaea acidophila]KAF2483832.1 hypothetical protein BDY17DRAFT_322731 [Neohortaea acidophila]